MINFFLRKSAEMVFFKPFTNTVKTDLTSLSNLDSSRTLN